MMSYINIPLEEKQDTNHAPNIFSGTDLMNLDLPDVRFIAKGYIPEGLTVLAGKPKCGKSWLGLDLCLSVTMPRLFCDVAECEAGAALYLALEDNQRRLKKRLTRLLSGEECPPNLFFCTQWPRLDDGGIEAIESWIKSQDNPRLAIIDTLAKVKARRGNGDRRLFLSYILPS